jgi:hypothetical protein
MFPLAAQRVWGRLGRFRGDGGLCDQLGGGYVALSMTPATSGGAIPDAVRWAERIMEEIDRRHPTEPSSPQTSQTQTASVPASSRFERG